MQRHSLTTAHNFFTRLFLWDKEHSEGFLNKLRIKTPYVSEDELYRCLMLTFKTKNLTALTKTFWSTYGKFVTNRVTGADGIDNYQFTVVPEETYNLFCALEELK